MQQRRLAAARQRNAVPDANCTAIGLIEHGAARFLAHGKNQLLSLFDLGPGLKDHTDRQIGWRYFFSGQYAVAVDRIVGTKIVVLEDQPRTRHRDAHVGISWRWRRVAICRPVSKQIELIE